MNFLVLYTHLTWPMHYFHAGVLARGLKNDGHNVLWVNCGKAMPGCHAQFIVPTLPPEDICTACVQRQGWLDEMGIEHHTLDTWLTDEDRAAAAAVRTVTDIRTLEAWMDGDAPVGVMARSSPVNAARMLSMDDPAPGFLENYQRAVESAILVHRALGRLLPGSAHNPRIDRMLLHLGRLVPEQVAQHHAAERGLPFYCFETGARRNTLRLYRDHTVYSRRFFRDRWPDFAEQPLTAAQIEHVQTWLALRRQSRAKSGMYTYSPVATSTRTLFEQLGVQPTRRLAVLFTSSVDEINMLSQLMDPDWRSLYADQYDFVREAIEWARARPDWVLVVRIHPNEGARANHLGMAGRKSMQRYADLLTRADLPPNVRIVLPEAQVSSYTLMETAAVGLVWGSSTGFEMSAVGRPVVCVDNPAYRTAGFVWNNPGPGHLAETIDAALSADVPTRRLNAVRAQRFAYHLAHRYVVPFPLVIDHGRMERISLGFKDPAELRRGLSPGLDAAVDYLARDVFPYEQPSGPDDARALWEATSIERLWAPELTLEDAPPRPESIQSDADFRAFAQTLGVDPTEASRLFSDLAELLKATPADGLIATVGPLAPALRAMAPMRNHLAIDPREDGPFGADLGGTPSALPIADRCAAAVIAWGPLGEAFEPAIRAMRRWVRPGGALFVCRGPLPEDAPVEVRLSGARAALAAAGLQRVSARKASDGGWVISGVVPGEYAAPTSRVRARDALAHALPPHRRERDRMLDATGKRVLLALRPGGWSAWESHLFPLQAVPDYYRFDRPEVRNLVPSAAKRVLDVGCAGGGLGAGLKRERPTLVVDGIEVVPHAARMADDVLDRVFCGPVEDVHVLLEDNAYDCIVFADVLEHTVDPAQVLALLRPKLKDDGVLVVSLPNIRHWSVVGPLLEGRFEYEDAGILDRTHLRFFTQQSMVDFFSSNAFDVTRMHKVPFGGEAPDAIVSALKDAGVRVDTLQDESGAYQYLLVCQKRPEPRARLTSIVLLAWNQLAYTQRCIESVLRNTHVPCELVLVDNGSADGTADYFRALKAEHPEVPIKLQLNRKNLGFAKGCNQGLALSNGDFVCFLNNDTIVADGWLEQLQWWADLEPTIGIVGPVSNRVAGIQKIEGVPYPQDAMTPEMVDALEAFAASWRAQNRHQSVQVNRIIGLCLLVKRELIERIGGFDTGFATGNYEDDDLCFRARVAGYRIVIARDVFLHHYGSKTFEGNKVDYSATMARNEARFLKKWGFEKTPDGYRSTGLDQIQYDRARHFAPYGAEEGFRADGRPVQVVEANTRNVLVVAPWAEGPQFDALLHTLARLGRTTATPVGVWLRCPAYEGTEFLGQLGSAAARLKLKPEALPDVLVVDAPLPTEREAGLYLAAQAVYVEEDWPEADLIVRRAVDCGVTLLRGAEELMTWVASAS